MLIKKLYAIVYNIRKYTIIQIWAGYRGRDFTGLLLTYVRIEIQIIYMYIKCASPFYFLLLSVDKTVYCLIKYIWIFISYGNKVRMQFFLWVSEVLVQRSYEIAMLLFCNYSEYSYPLKHLQDWIVIILTKIKKVIESRFWSPSEEKQGKKEKELLPYITWKGEVKAT